MQLSCMESSSGLTAQPLFLWITQANFDNFDAECLFAHANDICIV